MKELTVAPAKPVLLLAILFTLILMLPNSTNLLRATSSPFEAVTFDVSNKLYIPWSMAFDGITLYVIDTNGVLARIDTTALASLGTNAITTIQAFPFSSGGCCGNLAGAYGLTIYNRLAWAGASYNIGYGLARVSLANLTVQNYFSPGGSVVGLAADDRYTYAAVGGTIARFNQTDHSWSTLASASATGDLLPDGETLWFTWLSGLGRVYTNGTGLMLYSSGFSSNTARLAKASDGKIWFSENRAHKIGVFDPATGSVTEYEFAGNFGEFDDGPYGIAFDPNGKLWVTGGTIQEVRLFDTTSRTWDASATISLNGKSYTIISNGSSVWGDALGGTSPAIIYNIIPNTGAGIVGFAIAADPMSPELGQGTCAEVSVGVQSASDFSGAVSISLFTPVRLNSTIMPAAFYLQPSRTLNATLTVCAPTTVQPGIFVLTVAASDSTGTISRYVTIDVHVVQPYARILYSVLYVGFPWPHGNITFVNELSNRGLLPIQVVSLSIRIDFGTFTATKDLPLTLELRQAKTLNITITIPSNAALGNHTITASVGWQFFEHNQWNDAGTLTRQGSLPVRVAPPAIPPSIIGLRNVFAQILNLIRPYSLPAVLVYSAGVSLLSILVVRRDGRRRAPPATTTSSSHPS